MKEQLSVIKEVREELAKAYKESKDSVTTIEKLSKELEEANKTVESLTKELEGYKAKEAKAEKLAHEKRIEKLSANFKTLGQERTT